LLTYSHFLTSTNRKKEAANLRKRADIIRALKPVTLVK
jgi:hypothetical protein